VKRVSYLSLFVLLGLILQLVVHAVLEMGYIALLTGNWFVWGFGLSYGAWVVIHNILTVIFIIIGTWFGFSQGRYWWARIYD